MSDIHDTLKERGATHGDWTQQSLTSQRIKSALHQGTMWDQLTPSERDAIETIAMKMSRIVSGNPHEPDHWRDIVGYATLAHDEIVKKG